MKNIYLLTSIFFLFACTGQVNDNFGAASDEISITDTTRLTISHAIRLFDDEYTIIDIERLGYQKSDNVNLWHIADSTAGTISKSEPPLNHVIGTIQTRKELLHYFKLSSVRV